MADPTPWNRSGGPYRLPDPVRVLAVKTGNFSTGIGVLVDTGTHRGQQWLSAAWFNWPNTLFLL